MRILKYFLFTFVIILITIHFYIKNYLNSFINIKEDYYLFVSNGSNFYNISEELEKNKIINNKKLFILISKIIYKNNLKVYKGEFLIQKDFTIKDVMDTILQNKVYYRNITFAEGLSTNSIIKILNKEENLIGKLDPKNFEEGVYLPETYKYIKGETKITVLNRMKQAMDEFLNSVWDDREINKHIQNKYDLLKLASIVEKEASINEERPIVASVFLNRLDKKMRLQTDPSVIYSFAFGDTDLERRIRKKDLLNDVPYNTYRKNGLTPTPICNAGKNSIMAVLHPAKTDYLYFVANENGDGTHKFSKNYKTHRKFVKDYISGLNK